METLVTVHSWVRWLVLVALVGGIGVGIARYRSKDDWNASLFQLAVMVVDIQVTIGLAIYLFYDGWPRDTFYEIIHPGAMILALVVAHAGFAVAKKRKSTESWLIVSGSFAVSLILIIGAIPWERL